MRLIDVKKNIKYKIISILISDMKLKKYLFSMGLVKNTIVRVIRKSIFNGPIVINLRNYYLSISWDVASNIVVDYV